MTLLSVKELLPFFPKPLFGKIRNFEFFSGLMESHYTLPYRQYHNLDHIARLLQLAPSVYIPANISNEFYVAILFHDVVYNLRVGHGENERASAELAVFHGRRCFSEINWNLVESLIMATVHDGKLPYGLGDLVTPEQLMADLDLADLAADYSIFQDNSDKIIREYRSAFPLESVLAGRINFLRTFLERPHIYYGATFSENTARVNMRLDMERLTELHDREVQRRDADAPKLS